LPVGKQFFYRLPPPPQIRGNVTGRIGSASENLVLTGSGSGNSWTRRALFKSFILLILPSIYQLAVFCSCGRFYKI
jgi:hypothetical protein